jgi:hypothetical protein
VGSLAPRHPAFPRSGSASVDCNACTRSAVEASSRHRFAFLFFLSLMIVSVEFCAIDNFAAHLADGGESFADPSRLLAQRGVRGPTYYMSPGGSDANSGISTSSPWKTFGYAIPKLNAGDTLVLMDGTYTTAGSGNLTINCTAKGNARNGSAGAPITVTAQNQRKALLQNDGASRPVLLDGCGWWVI